MTKKVQYTSAGGDGLPGRADVISANSTMYLIEEQNIAEGNFLIFQDTKPVPTVEQTVGTLVTTVTNIQSALAAQMGV